MAKGRMTKAEKELKISQGKELFVKGFTLKDISNIIKVGEKTLANWRDKYKWEEEKELASLKPSTVRNLTLKCALAIEKGEPLPYKADDVSKIVAAFDRITDSRKKAVYTMESIDGFSNYMITKAGKAKGQKRDELLAFLKEARLHFDKYVTELISNE